MSGYHAVSTSDVQTASLSGTTELTHCVVGVFRQKLITVFTDLVNNLLYETMTFNPLKPELNPICYLLALLGAHHFLHVSR